MALRDDDSQTLRLVVRKEDVFDGCKPKGFTQIFDVAKHRGTQIPKNTIIWKVFIAGQKSVVFSDPVEDSVLADCAKKRKSIIRQIEADCAVNHGDLVHYGLNSGVEKAVLGRRHRLYDDLSGEQKQAD